MNFDIALAWIIHNPRRKHGISCWSLAYTAGYEKQSVFEQAFVISIAAVTYEEVV